MLGYPFVNHFRGTKPLRLLPRTAFKSRLARGKSKILSGKRTIPTRKRNRALQESRTQARRAVPIVQKEIASNKNGRKYAKKGSYNNMLRRALRREMKPRKPFAFSPSLAQILRDIKKECNEGNHSRKFLESRLRTAMLLAKAEPIIRYENARHAYLKACRESKREYSEKSMAARAGRSSSH